MSKAVIITGEASETDSEDEVKNSATDINFTQSVQGTLITGEDTESENESNTSLGSATSALEKLNAQDKPVDIKYDSLFHQKLRESNARLRSDLENVCYNTVSEAGKTLAAIDQQLIHSQVTLQNAVTSLKTLSSNSICVKNKLQSMLSAKFLSSVNC